MNFCGSLKLDDTRQRKDVHDSMLFDAVCNDLSAELVCGLTVVKLVDLAHSRPMELPWLGISAPG